MDKRVICIQGPTASGKSELAEMLARKLDGEIVSADSMQVYKGMDIGTAKVPLEKRGVPYHCIDILEPGVAYSAACFQRDARQAFNDTTSRGKRVVLCGGTGFYVRAALDDMHFAPGEQAENPIRQKYEEYYRENGEMALFELLQSRDPESAEVVHVNDVKRVIRALEMHEEGESYAARKSRFKTVKPCIESTRIALGVERRVLYERIEMRVDTMVEEGLLDEVYTLLKSGFRSALTATQAIGYKELVAYLDGDCSLDEAIRVIKQATRRYAKRQMTWLRSDSSLHWIDATDGDSARIYSEALALLDL